MDVITVAVLLASASGCASEPADLRHLEAFLVQSLRSPRRNLRPDYHVSPPSGWLTAPAAFVHYERAYHLFYQYHPYDGAWGPARWGHAASADLVHWAHYPPALLPAEPHDRFGCLAGSALVHDSRLVLFYTGLALAGNATRHTQSLAVSGDAVVFHKYAYNPVIRTAPPHATEVREPKVWRHRGAWLMLTGATVAKRGALLRFASPDLHSWREDGVAARSLGDVGDAWESPDLFELDGFCVLVLSARGLRPDGDRFHDPRRTGYALRRSGIDCPSARLDDFEVSTATFEELDYGHDLYAARTTLAPDGRRLLVAALGGGPEAREGWAGVLSLTRELRVGRRGLISIPAREVSALRGELLERAMYSPEESYEAGARAFELLANTSSAAEDAELTLEWEGGQYTVRYEAARGRVAVERTQGDGGGDERAADWAPAGGLHWRVFVDRSSVEVFCGGGEVVFSSRIFPRGPLRVRVGAQAAMHLTQYRIRRSVGYDRELTKYIKDQYVLSKHDNSPIN